MPTSTGSLLITPLSAPKRNILERIMRNCHDNTVRTHPFYIFRSINPKRLYRFPSQ
jgi:hypothetical protein